MICLTNGPLPQVLVENGKAWTEEYVTWRENRVGTEPRRYAHPEIRSALEKETFSKCAYCEGRIGDVAYPNIEHKRPKDQNPTLVCDWENLTIACPKCNTNKGNYNDQDCPLLDPYIDDVEEDVAFWGPMALPRSGYRANATITLLQLNRSCLLFSRKDVLEKLYRLLNLIERAADIPAAQRSLWLEIDAMTAAAGEFASACRQFLTAQMAERGLTRS